MSTVEGESKSAVTSLAGTGKGEPAISQQTEPTPPAKALDLFYDIAENCANPIPSLAGC